MSLFKFAKQYAVNQSKYAHLNAFITRVDPLSLTDRPETVQLPKSDDESMLHSPRGKLVAIKDNICTKELRTTAASGILKDFASPYDATVVKLLQDAGAAVVGKTNMDEFGMGSHSIHSHAGPVKMQRYEGEEASAGGSSGGSAMAVASAQCWAALGTDTGGSVRLPAAYTSVVGFKPSYGLLSRWGVIAYANSLDTVGIFAKDARIVEDLFDKLNVYDPQDPTSLPPSTRARLRPKEESARTLRIGIPLDYNIATLHPAVRNAWMRALRALAEKGHTLHPVRLPATQHALSAYYVLAPAEASSNLAKYDGVRYGSRAEGIDGTPESVLFAKTRGQGFSPEVQRRILLGAFSLSAQAIDNYFIQAQKVRRLVQQDFNNVFSRNHPLIEDETTSRSAEEKVDLLLCPTAPTLAPSLADVKNQDPIQSYINDVFTVPASLAGLPAISVPVHITDEERVAIHGDHDIKESAGVQIIGQYGDDKLVLNVARQLQHVCKTIQRRAGPDLTAWGDSSLGKTSVNARKRYGPTAMEMGISLEEAIPIVDKELKMKEEELTKITYERLGAKHLEEAAAIHNMQPKDYIARFVGEDDPLAAEEAFYEKMMAWKNSVEAHREAKPGSKAGVGHRRLAATTPLRELQWKRPSSERREAVVRFVAPRDKTAKAGEEEDSKPLVRFYTHEDKAAKAGKKDDGEPVAVEAELSPDAESGVDRMEKNEGGSISAEGGKTLLIRRVAYDDTLKWKQIAKQERAEARERRKQRLHDPLDSHSEPDGETIVDTADQK